MEFEEQKMIAYDGLVHPFPPFNWLLFLTFELITIVVEAMMCYWIGKSLYIDAESKKKFGLSDAFLLSVCMNVVSACLAIPIWLSLGVGL